MKHTNYFKKAKKLEAINKELLEACKFALICMQEKWRDLSNAEVVLKQVIAKTEKKE